MAVYIDKARISYRGMKMSHMIADTLPELHRMATKLGVRNHFQNKPGKPHYDVCEKNRLLAIKFGALPVERKELIEKLSAHRTASIAVLVDTREQKPVWRGKECKKVKLDYGDYTTEKLHGKYHIERKSLQDLYGSIIQGHVRFRNELIGAKTNGVKLSLYVEGSRNNFIAKKFPGGHRRLINGNVLAKIVYTVENRYGIDVVWCGSRATAKKMMVERFKIEERKLKSISKV